MPAKSRVVRKQKNRANRKMSERLLVASGILIEGERVLLCQRPEPGRLAGKWEFPGGKMLPGEEPRQAVRREIDEELGVEVEVGRPYEISQYHYESGTVLLLFFLCRINKGRLSDHHYTNTAWVRGDELMDYDVPPANQHLISRLRADMPLKFS